MDKSEYLKIFEKKRAVLFLFKKSTQFVKLGMRIWLALILFSLFLASCSLPEVLPVQAPVKEPTSTAVPPREEPVDGLLVEFYRILGGRNVLGPAISKLEERAGNLKCQYTEAALLCFNSTVTGPSRYSIHPLGKELDLVEDTRIDLSPLDEDARVVNGIVIYEKILPLYDKLFGARYVGHPMTGLRYNARLHRYEQFFENLGFYQDANFPEGEVKLISYGAYLCGPDCSYKLSEYWGIMQTRQIEQPFSSGLWRIGGICGDPLLKPGVALDGYLEQVYENCIVFGLEDGTVLGLRPLAKELHYGVKPPVANKNHPTLIFFPTDPSGLGHNVPVQFDGFIAVHGGYEMSGQPISEVHQLADSNLFEQCFENYCLIFNPAASASLQFQLRPLGEGYLKSFPPSEELQPKPLYSPDSIVLVAGADKPNLNRKQEQHIRITVQEKLKESGDLRPLDRVEGLLLLNFPDGTMARYFFPPTDEEGMSVVVIPPRSTLEVGTRLQYQACLNLPSEEPICNMQSYLIWE